MNCEEFRNLWSDWHDGHDDVDDAAMARHRDTCSECARHDRQMRTLLDGLATLPLPGEQPERAGWAAPRWAALAATLVVGIALGLVLAQRDGPASAPSAPPVELAAAGEQRIAIAVESPRQYDDVEFTVQLPEGVELAGFPGQREVRWTGSLAEGRSRLRLPLRISSDATGGELVARIRHAGGERQLVVPLADGSAALEIDGVSV